MNRDEQIRRLREASEAIRAEWEGDRGSAWVPVQQFHLSVAAWFDAEAATQGGLEPFANLMSAAIEAAGGPAGYIRIGRNEAGELAMHTDVMPAALRAAEAYLSGSLR